MRRLSGFSLSFQKLGFSLAKRENPASPAGAQEEENQGSLLPIQHSENQRTVNCPKDKRESSRGYLCRATRWSRVYGWHLRIRRLVQFIFAGSVYNNALTSCAARVCSALLEVNRLCSSMVSGTADSSAHGSTLCSPTVEKILCRSPFRSGRRSLVCARLTNKRKLESQEDRNLGVYPFGTPAKG